MRKMIYVLGAEKVIRNLSRMQNGSRTAFVAGFQKCLLLVEREAVKLVSFGALRAVDTGAMRSTITSGITNMTWNSIEGVVSVGKHYSIFVHQGLGAHTGNPRPFMRRALRNKAKRCIEIMRSHVLGGLEVLGIR